MNCPSCATVSTRTRSDGFTNKKKTKKLAETVNVECNMYNKTVFTKRLLILALKSLIQ